ncbi:hypothetical protein AB7008_48170 [Bradyrhizobium sp. 521_C7_N1_3]|uniref:Nmad2 family putative nucleotide modification protein n=1 Tax=Bradyrhizobium sp. 521_C7_N1_3 TaxID=3240368 RepID=UPI003F8C2571
MQPKVCRYAKIGNWLLGTDSVDKKIRRAGHFVDSMQVTEVLSSDQYNTDPRFSKSLSGRSSGIA